MASAVEAPTFKRFVEVGRVVRVTESGKLAVITEIIDHGRVMIDGPSTGVARQQSSLKNVVLTPFVLKKLPRAAGQSALKKAWEASGVEEKWNNSAWAKKIARKQKRANLSDFERFKVQKLRSQRSKQVGKALKANKSS